MSEPTCGDPGRHKSEQAEAREHRALIKLGAEASLEIGVHEAGAVSKWCDLIAPQTEIYINAVPGQRSSDTVATARQLRDAGFEPVPHVPVRRLKDAEELHALLEKLRAAAQVRKLLLIAGDHAKPIGDFYSVSDALRTGAFAAYGVEHICVAGHPEGHPHVHEAQLRAAEDEKVQLAAELGLGLSFVTQFAFSTAPIVAWEHQLRARGIRSDVQIGLAGPARLSTLLKYAMRCGVGASIAALSSHVGMIGKLVNDRRPDRLVRELARARAAGELNFQGVHLFSFGGVARTARWICALREGRFSLPEHEGLFMREED